MTAPAPYLHLAGDARQALEFWRGVFGGEVIAHTFADFGRTDGEGSLVAHGTLEGPVHLFAADVAGAERPFSADGLLLSLLGHADSGVLRRWFDDLSVDGDVVDPLQRREWGAHDGRVRDRYGVTWLIGWEGD